MVFSWPFLNAEENNTFPCLIWTWQPCFPFLSFSSFLSLFFFLLAECFSLLKTDCIHCGDRCWLDLKDKSRSCPKRLTLKVQPKKKSFVYNDDDDSNDISDKSSCSMNQADHGTGALYIIMDAIKTLKADKEAEEKGWQFIFPLKSSFNTLFQQAFAVWSHSNNP